MTTRYRLSRGKESCGIDVTGDRVSVSTRQGEETFACGTNREALNQARALVAARLSEGFAYVQRPQDPDAPRMQPTSLGALREHFQEHGPETFAEAVSRGNTWLAELKSAGHSAALEAEFGECERAVEQGRPVEPALLARVESELGFTLPPSYRDFLSRVGSVSFLNAWWDATTPPEMLVSHSRSLMDLRHDFSWRASALFQGLESPRLLRVCDHHNGDDWFYVCDFRDAAGEAPLYLGYHEESELYHGPDPRALRVQVEPRGAGLAHSEAPLSTPLVSDLSALFADAKVTQREKLAAIRGPLWPRLQLAEGDELAWALHALKKGLGSPKLAADRDAVLGALRRDGLSGDAPLPVRPTVAAAKASSPPRKPAPRFARFEQWLSERVDLMMDEVHARIEARGARRKS